MNAIIKNIIISIIVGILAYLIFGLATGTGLSAPADSHQIAALATYIIAVFVGSTIATIFNGSATGGASAASGAGASNLMSKESGTVKWFNVKKGYGFITRDQGDDIFVHYRNIEGSGRKAVSEGQRVKFLVIDGDKGLQADEVEAL
mgnify:FL=1